MKPRKFGCHVIYSASVRPYVRTSVRTETALRVRECMCSLWAQVDLPASLMLINTHALVDVGQPG